MKNIGILCGYPFPKGLAATNRIITYSKGLVEIGCNVKVYIYRPTEKKEDLKNLSAKGKFKGIEYEYSRNKHIRSLNKFLHGFEILIGVITTLYTIFRNHKHKKFDAILVSNDTPVILFLVNMLNKTLKIKTIFIFDEYPKPIRGKLKSKIPKLKQIAYRIALSSFDGFISISQNLIDFYLKIVRREIRSFKMASIVNTEPFVKAIKDTSSPEYICYMGNLELSKDNIDNIIRAFSIIEEKWQGLDFYIFGKGSTSDMKFLQELIESLKLTHKVVLKGLVDFEKVPQIVKNAKILVSSQPDTLRAQGGFPTKLGEYLASGVPTLMTNVGEISIYIEDGVNAFIVEPNNPREYAKKLDFILSNYNQAEIVANEGQKLMIEKYDYIKQSKALLTFLS